MKLIVGLGNPGKEYAGTRHNIGFDVIDAFASAHGVRVDQRIGRARVGRCRIGDEPVLLAKPQTFMNLSGEAVAALMRREQIPLENLIVVCDDVHLPVGRLRLRMKGSSGGQNGLKSIAAHLATQEWSRLRFGVGEAPPGLQVDWVLGRFSRADRKTVDDSIILAVGALEVFVRDGIETAMNRYNVYPPLDVGPSSL